ncbi:hypothetical protein JKP88DRAFT_243571 [Tribonema minus]|uniref:Uncharacterized protein n=1 Tax=Tribonema minus TaxID=303371 RepID=A0A836CKB7_9STRA|nr:hypothetical protein JKP88DRAFT_243571 [Tribonema minus]
MPVSNTHHTRAIQFRLVPGVCGGAPTRGGGDEFGHRKRVCRNEHCALAQAAEGGLAVIDRDTNARANLGMRGVYATCGVDDIIPGYVLADQEEEEDTEDEESDEEDDDEEDGDEEDGEEEDGEEGGDGDEGGGGGGGGDRRGGLSCDVRDCCSSTYHQPKLQKQQTQPEGCAADPRPVNDMYTLKGEKGGRKIWCAKGHTVKNESFHRTLNTLVDRISAILPELMEPCIALLAWHHNRRRNIE